MLIRICKIIFIKLVKLFNRMELKIKFTEFLPKIIKPGSYEILRALKDGPKTWSELERLEDMNSAKLKRRLEDLISANLVTVDVVLDRKPTGSKVYKLTPLGLAILKKLEEIEEIYEKYKDTPTVEEAVELVEKKKVKPDKVVKLGREEIL